MSTGNFWANMHDSISKKSWKHEKPNFTQYNVLHSQAKEHGITENILHGKANWNNILRTQSPNHMYYVISKDYVRCVFAGVLLRLVEVYATHLAQRWRTISSTTNVNYILDANRYAFAYPHWQGLGVSVLPIFCFSS